MHYVIKIYWDIKKKDLATEKKNFSHVFFWLKHIHDIHLYIGNNWISLDR